MLYSEKPCSVRWAWGSSVFLKAYKPTSLQGTRGGGGHKSRPGERTSTRATSQERSYWQCSLPKWAAAAAQNQWRQDIFRPHVHPRWAGMTRAGGWSTAHRLGWRADGLDGRKGGQLLSFSAAGRRHDCYFTMLVCHACRVTLVSRACFAGVHALAPCAPVQSRHATSSLVACYPLFPVCQSLARMSLAVYSRCSLARWISYLSLCCMLFCTPPIGQGLSPSNWLHPSGDYPASVFRRDIDMATRE